MHFDAWQAEKERHAAGADNSKTFPLYISQLEAWEQRYTAAKIIDPAMLFTQERRTGSNASFETLVVQHHSRSEPDGLATVRRRPHAPCSLLEGVLRLLALVRRGRLRQQQPAALMLTTSHRHPHLPQAADVLAERGDTIVELGKRAVDRRRAGGSRPTPHELWRALRKLDGAIGAELHREARIGLTAAFRLDREGRLAPSELRRHFCAGGQSPAHCGTLAHLLAFDTLTLSALIRSCGVGPGVGPGTCPRAADRGQKATQSEQ